MRHRQSSGGPLWPFIAVAVLLHLNAGGAGYMYARTFGQRLDEVGAGEDRQDVGLIDGEDARRLLEEMQAEAKKKADEEAKKEEEDPRARGQIVEVARPIEERRPEQSKYLSQYDTTTVKETKARVRGPDVKPGAAVPRTPAPMAQPTPPMPRPSGGPPAPAMPNGRPGTPGKASLLAMRTATPPAPDGDRAAGADGLEKTTPEGDGGKPARAPGGARRPLAMGDLLPSAQQVSRQAGGAMNDYLRDAEEAEETALNARRWKFASFFNRLQRSVSQNWHPDVEYKRRDPSGNVYGYRDRLTIVRVKLKPDGSLANLALEHPCGVDFLDDEALEALKRAQPFPNPPRQLVDDSTGLISFRFGFMFELSTGSSFRVFRYQN